MPFLINIGIMKTNGVTTNGNVDIGAAVQNSHTANSKWVGFNQVFGDLSPSLSGSSNGVLDPDISDQAQNGNPSSPIANQL